CWEEVFYGPVRRRIRGRSSDNCVAGKSIAAKAGVEGNDGIIVEGTVPRTAAGGPHWVGAGTHDAVCEDKVLHRVSDRDHSADHEQHFRGERRNVINVYILQEGCACTRRDLCELTWTGVLHAVDVIDHDVVDTIALPVERGAKVIRQSIRDLKSPAHMANGVVADRHVRDLANWA